MFISTLAMSCGNSFQSTYSFFIILEENNFKSFGMLMWPNNNNFTFLNSLNIFMKTGITISKSEICEILPLKYPITISSCLLILDLISKAFRLNLNISSLATL